MAQANPPPAQPRMVIDQSGSGDFRTIGEAIRASVVPHGCSQKFLFQIIHIGKNLPTLPVD